LRSLCIDGINKNTLGLAAVAYPRKKNKNLYKKTKIKMFSKIKAFCSCFYLPLIAPMECINRIHKFIHLKFIIFIFLCVFEFLKLFSVQLLVNFNWIRFFFSRSISKFVGKSFESFKFKLLIATQWKFVVTSKRTIGLVKSFIAMIREKGL
jgi:hypothetical protein